jgi:hypothetical protein
MRWLLICDGSIEGEFATEGEALDRADEVIDQYRRDNADEWRGEPSVMVVFKKHEWELRDVLGVDQKHYADLLPVRFDS